MDDRGTFAVGDFVLIQGHGDILNIDPSGFTGRVVAPGPYGEGTMTVEWVPGAYGRCTDGRPGYTRSDLEGWDSFDPDYLIELPEELLEEAAARWMIDALSA
jgi:hypothetical protein